MPIELEKNGDSPATCRINNEKIKAGIEGLERRLDMVESKLEIITAMSEDVKDMKREISSLTKTNGTKTDNPNQGYLGQVSGTINSIIVFLFLLLMVGKMDIPTFQKILTLLGGS